MTEIKNTLKEYGDWEAVELSASFDLLSSLAQRLYEESRFLNILKQSGGISIMGFVITINGEQNQVSAHTAITSALEKFKKKGKKLLICIDEIIANDYVKKFASVFQILIRDDLPIYLLMTGLYDNIYDLKNEKNLTFLYRAPQLKINPLNLGTIAENYKENFDLNETDSLKMSALTKGYSFAFQVLGYYTYRHDGDYRKAVSEYRQYLEEYSYEKIWAELSKEVLGLIYYLKNDKF